MGRPSDHTEALCQCLADDLVELRSMGLGLDADRVLERMQNRINDFDHTFGRPVDLTADHDDDDDGLPGVR